MSAALGEILPTDEYNQLQDCERIIEEGYNTFLKVGLALAKVRDARLYRASHDTFEAYCESRWAISRTRAYELIGSAGITEALSAMADIPAPTNERQARELHGLDPETAAEVMASAVDESGNLTAAAIREARQEIAPKPAHITTTTRTTEATKVEHDVDLETGEITSPGSRAPLQDSAPGVEQLSEPGALDQWLDDDDNLRRARFNKLFYADIARATRITANTAEELAELGDDDALSEYESLINNLERHCQRAKALRGSHLEIVR